MPENPLVDLARAGQSVWYDQMERALLTTGALKKMIEEDDLRGLTSNPTIFEKAIGGSDDYNEDLHALAEKQKSRDEIFEALVLDDIGKAADVFRPVYDRTGGGDGFVSIEVSPDLADDTAGTAAEAARLWKALGRPNVMVKIPATPAGIPAIEQSIAAGININITLIFSRSVYEQVIDAYLRGLERRAAANQPVDRIASVASFFVSRIDTAIDKQIDARIAASSDEREKKELASLKGKAAIANAKLAYELFQKRFGDPRFEALRARGARVQRPLWASTGTKNPEYSDVLYVENLIGPDTVNTVPPATYNAFKDHGKVSRTIDRDLEQAREVLAKIERAGISLEETTRQLTVDGVKSFAGSFRSLLETIDARRAAEVGR
jgi:transaldolase/glucose-6-phosphate isomerase